MTVVLRLKWVHVLAACYLLSLVCAAFYGAGGSWSDERRYNLLLSASDWAQPSFRLLRLAFGESLRANPSGDGYHLAREVGVAASGNLLMFYALLIILGGRLRRRSRRQVK